MPRLAATSGIQLRFPEKSSMLVLVSDSISGESRVQAAGAFDISVRAEAHHVFRNMSTPRAGSFRPVKQAVPSNEPHIFEF